MNQIKHVPVLSDEVLAVFDGHKISVFVDATVGMGGHAAALLESHPEIEKYIGIDQDSNALKEAEKNLKPWKDKVLLKKSNFSDLDKVLDEAGIEKVDGFLFDIGVSSMQLDEGDRGFSFNKDAVLDMRMDMSRNLTAEEAVNTLPEKELERIFFEYGEEPEAKKIAKYIVEKRKEKPIVTTKELAKLIVDIKKSRRKIHPATLVFQGLRIYVNEELDVLEKALPKAACKLNENGRLAVISFHSLEDGIVKRIFKDLTKKKHVNIYRQENVPPKFKLLVKKPSMASNKEIKKNKRSRSAKLRAIEKIG